MGTTGGNARASGSGAQSSERRQASETIDMTSDTDSGSNRQQQPQPHSLIQRVTTNVRVLQNTVKPKPLKATSFGPQDPTTKAPQGPTAKILKPGGVPSPFGNHFFNGSNFDSDNNSKKSAGGSSRVYGDAVSRIASSAFAIPRKTPGQRDVNPHDAIAAKRMTGVDEAYARSYPPTDRSAYHDHPPAAQPTTKRGGGKVSGMQGKEQSASNQGNGSKPTKQGVLPYHHLTNTNTNTNASTSIKGKGKAKEAVAREELVINTSDEEEEIVDDDRPPSSKPRATRFSPQQIANRRIAEEEELPLRSGEVPNRSINGVQPGRVKQIAAHYEKQSGASVEQDPDASFDSCLPESNTVVKPNKAAKASISIPVLYYRIGNSPLTTNYLNSQHNLVLMAGSPNLTLSRRDGPNETSYPFKIASEIHSMIPPLEDYKTHIMLEIVCNPNCAGYTHFLRDHSGIQFNPENRSIQFFFELPTKENGVGKLKEIVDHVVASKGKSNILVGSSGGQKSVWDQFYEEFDNLRNAPSTRIQQPAQRRTSVGVPFAVGSAPPGSRMVASTPAKVDLSRAADPASFYGEAVHASTTHGTRSGGKAPVKNWLEDNAAPIPDPTFDAPVENADEIALVWPRDVKGAFSLTRGDLARLNEHQYLNDTLIELGLKRIMNQISEQKSELADSIHVFNSFFYQKLSMKAVRRVKSAPAPYTSISENYKAVRRWTQKVDLFSKKYIIIPINEHYHWYLAIIVNPAAILREVIEPVSDLGGTRAQTRHSLGGFDSPTKASQQGSVDAGPSRISDAMDIDTGFVAGSENFERAIYSPPSARPQSTNRRSIVNPDLGSTDVSDDAEDAAAVARELKSPPKFPGVGKSLRGVASAIAELGSGSVTPVITDTEAAEMLSGLAEVGAMEDTTMGDISALDAVPVSSPAQPHDLCYIFTFDSLGSPHKPVCNKLRDYLVEEANDKKQITRPSVKLLSGKAVKVPQQPNTADCGFYLLHYAERFFLNDLGGPEEMTRYMTAKPKGKLEDQVKEMNANWDRDTVLLKRKAMRDGMTIESIDWLAWREPFKKIEEEELAAKREKKKNARADANDPELKRALQASLAESAAMVASGSGAGAGKGKRKLIEEDGKTSAEMKEGRSGSSKAEDPKENRQRAKNSKSKSAEASYILIEDDDDPSSSPAKLAPESRPAPPKIVSLLTSTNPPSSVSDALPDALPDSALAGPPIISRGFASRSVSAPMELDDSSQSAIDLLPPHSLDNHPTPRSQSSPPPTATTSTYTSKHFSPKASTSKKSLLNPSHSTHIRAHPIGLEIPTLPTIPTALFPMLSKTLAPTSIGKLIVPGEDSQTGTTSDEEEPASRRAVKRPKIENGTEATKLGIRGAALSTGASGNGMSSSTRASSSSEAGTNGVAPNRGMSISGIAAKSIPKATELSIKGIGSQEDDDDIVIVEPLVLTGLAATAVEKRDREDEVEEVLQDGQGKHKRWSRR